MSQVDLFDHFTAKSKSLTWVIENFEKTSNQGSPDIKLSSGRLYLNVHPNEDLPGYLGKQVIISFTPTAYINLPIFYYRISLINEKGLNLNTQEGRVKSDSNSKGFNSKHIVSREYLLNKANGFLPDGKLTIYCEVFELNAECIESGINRDNLVSLSNDNQSLLESGVMSDVVVAVSEREFKVHKLILSSRSVVFKKMFEHDLEESKSNRVDITDMSAGAVDELLKFIYTGRVYDLDQHVYELYVAADKYQIDSLKSYCGLYLAMSLSVSTVPKILQLADLYSLGELKSKCINYITIHSTEFKFDDWKELTTSRPELMFGVFQALGNKSK